MVVKCAWLVLAIVTKKKFQHKTNIVVEVPKKMITDQVLQKIGIVYHFWKGAFKNIIKKISYIYIHCIIFNGTLLKFDFHWHF